MAETLGTVVVLLLSVYGLMEGIRRLIARLLYSPCGERGICVLWFAGHCEDVEYTVRCAAARCRDTLPLCVVELDTDEETHAVLEHIGRAVRGVEVFTPSTFCERFF